MVSAGRTGLKAITDEGGTKNPGYAHLDPATILLGQKQISILSKKLFGYLVDGEAFRVFC